ARAIRAWFDAHAWRIRFRGSAEEALDDLRSAGAAKIVGLVYAHKPGAARALNEYLGELCRAHAGVVGVGTVLPGEPDVGAIGEDAISKHGLRGIKLHCHVQKMSIDDPRVVDVLSYCEELGVPAVVHAGRQPKTDGYGVDPTAICGVARTEAVLRACP